MRKIAIALAAVMAAGLLAGCSGTVTGAKAQGEGGRKPAYSGLEDLPESLSADGSMIVVGDPQAPTTVRLYEDLSVYVCRDFETTDIGPDLRSLMLAGEVKTEYVFSSMLDDDWEDGDALWVINALRAALEQDKFTEYHQLVAENYTKGGYTKASLLRLASRVPGLRSAAFDLAVDGGRYYDFLLAAEDTYDEADPGVPSLAINGKILPTARQSSLYGKGHLSDHIHSLQ